ncbi:MAG TPA: MBL fold metallo-hydrolase [Gemmatimonadota bacterium]|nr:MBL fold metallo-hydrolase [Gemmatimonadota bacterium]
MPEHRRLDLAPDLTVLCADNAGPMTLDGTRSYLIGREHLAIVDPGPNRPGQLEALARIVNGRDVAVVLLTHAHADHAGAAAGAARRFGAELRASADTLSRLGPGVDGRALEDGETVTPEEGLSLTAIHAPGHSADHVCYLAEPGRRLLTGDLVLGEGSSAILHPDGRVADSLASLARLIALRPALLLPGHGPPIEAAMSRLEEYRRHRLERERQVRAAIAAGARTVPEIREAVYGTLPDGLTWAADASVAAHLAALAERGETVPDYGAWAADEEDAGAR